jgi:hypothetical protein
MKPRATNGLILITIVLTIIGLNFLLYADSSDKQEAEWSGSRSTYSSRPFGMRGFYLLLRDLGYPVMQFEEPLDQLQNHAEIKALLIIGPPRPFSSEEFAGLESWIKAGGYLVIVDREISWSIAGGRITMRTYAKPWQLPHMIQPTPFTAGVGKVQLTEFARGVEAENAPITSHIGDKESAVLIDFRYGSGRIVLLGEPYILANNGIEASGNLTLALNIIRDMPKGMIAFDEYHHGYGAASRARTGMVGAVLNLYAYFKRTPVLGILAQLGLIACAWIYSRAWRFTHPIPLPEEKRRRSIEYVASMANLARRHGLRAVVLENVHRSLKRHLPSLGRPDTPTSAPSGVARRLAIDQREIHQLLRTGEPSTNGPPMSDHQLIDWVRRIREFEAHIGRTK